MDLDSNNLLIIDRTTMYQLNIENFTIKRYLELNKQCINNIKCDYILNM